jgi:hypothetical protein
LSEKFHYTVHHLYPVVKNILLRHLPALRSLDLGFHSSHFILVWNIAYVQAPLTYLRITLLNVSTLLDIMATRSLSTTLRQLHVKICDVGVDRTFRVSDINISFSMSSLRTFTFVKPLLNQFDNEWRFVDALTSYQVMPMLQRANIIVAITVADLDQINQSMLFNDDRLVDVHYAFILNDNLSHIDLNKRIPCGSRSHPRLIASATFVKGARTDYLPDFSPDAYYVSHYFETFCFP